MYSLFLKWQDSKQETVRNQLLRTDNFYNKFTLLR